VLPLPVLDDESTEAREMAEESRHTSQASASSLRGVRNLDASATL
jgi:hypothetical protein